MKGADRLGSWVWFVWLVALWPLSLEAAEPLPQRIISLGPLHTENLYLLGAESRLIANTRYCVRPAAAKKLEKIGSVLQVSIEKIISLRPDLVLAPSLTQPQQIAALQRLGIRVVQTRQPHSFVDLCEQLLALGRLLGLEARAKQVIAQSQGQVALVQQAVAGRPRPKVLLQIGAQPLFVATRASFTHDYIALAGGDNQAADASYGRYHYERAIADNPDVILIAVMGRQSHIGGAEKKRWQRYPVISAVQEQRILLLDPDRLCSPSPLTFAEMLTEMATYLHPGIALPPAVY